MAASVAAATCTATAAPLPGRPQAPPAPRPNPSLACAPETPATAPPPGAPGYLEHLSAGGYSTVLLDAPHEVHKPWDPNWEMGKADAVSVSLRW